MSLEKFLDQGDDGVDPRVQIELERLNSATNEINRLEVDLDEARNQFRQLLQESTSRIDGCAKRLGSCVVKVRPYYDARIRAKEALQETQKAAVNFERANSAHAAAKEMVYLAEEGLKAEGRTFDHAWQEMLNHATMRVNESESERTLAEAEHKRTSQNYQVAEIRVRTLQKDLKRAITKSRPYFELKIHYTQLLEKQKLKVKNLEKLVAEVKLSYAQTLKNLERISDEIHKTRQKNKHSGIPDLGKRSEGVGAESDSSNGLPSLYDLTKAKSGCAKSMENQHRSKEDSETGSPDSENDSSLTGPPDTESEDEMFKFPQNPNCLAVIRNQEFEIEIPKAQSIGFQVHSATGFPDVNAAGDSTLVKSIIENLEFERRKEDTPKEIFEGVGICSFPALTDLNLKFEEGEKEKDDAAEGSVWTEIKLTSPEEKIFSTMKLNPSKSRNELEEDFDIPYAPLSDGDFVNANHSDAESPGEKKSELILSDCPEKGRLEGMLCGLGGRSGKRESSEGGELNSRSLKGTPKKINLRRQSLDVLWNNTAGEKMKEILSQSIMKLNIGSLTEKNSRTGEGNNFGEDEPSINNIRANDSAYESNLTSQFGINFFNRKNSKVEEDFIQTAGGEEKKSINAQESISTQLGGFMSRKERFSFKKVPSPLEKTLNYLNADEESNSDSESLASSDMLTDEQLSSLVLDRDLADIYQDLI